MESKFIEDWIGKGEVGHGEDTDVRLSAPWFYSSIGCPRYFVPISSLGHGEDTEFDYVINLV